MNKQDTPTCVVCGKGVVPALTLCPHCGAAWRTGVKPRFFPGGFLSSAYPLKGQCAHCRRQFRYKGGEEISACPLCAEPIDRIRRTRLQKLWLVVWSVVFLWTTSLWVSSLAGDRGYGLVALGLLLSTVAFQFVRLAWTRRL